MGLPVGTRLTRRAGDPGRVDAFAEQSVRDAARLTPHHAGHAQTVNDRMWCVDGR